MKYPNVRNSHIVPKAYLRNFSIGEKIEVHPVGKAGSMTRPIDKAGVRLRFYRRTRPDGTKIDDIEWALSRSEDKAAPILQAIDARWPLLTQGKAILAEFFAYQAIRGPRWMEWRDESTRAWIAELRQRPDDMGVESTDPQATITDLEEHLLADTQRFMQMLEVGRKLASALGSMHWTLVGFASPIVATSDHPVVIWPGGEGARQPQAAAQIGFLETLEVRVPVSPTNLILMTWVDVADTARCSVHGLRHHAANVNAFTVAQAERQWFHLPGRTPPRATCDGLDACLVRLVVCSRSARPGPPRLAGCEHPGVCALTPAIRSGAAQIVVRPEPLTNRSCELSQNAGSTTTPGFWPTRPAPMREAKCASLIGAVGLLMVPLIVLERKTSRPQPLKRSGVHALGSYSGASARPALRVTLP